MVKLYSGNSDAIITTLLLGVNIGYMIWGYLSRAAIQKWGMIILLFILLHGALWYFANVRDRYCDSIIYATDGSVGMGLFSVSSIQSIVFWIASVIIWVLGIVSIFEPEYRQNNFFVIVVVSIVQIAFIEGSRIWLYNSVPTRFDYM